MSERSIASQNEEAWIDRTLQFFKDDWETLEWLESLAVVVTPGKITIEIPHAGRWRGLREHYRRNVK